MKDFLYWTSLRIVRNRKIRVLSILFLTFFASFSLLYRQQELTFPYYEMREEYQDEQQIYRLIPPQHFEGELGHEVQQRLGSNSVSLGVQRYLLKEEDGNTFNELIDLPNYIEVGQQLAENNLFLYEATDFGSYDLLVNEYLPPEDMIYEQIRFFDALEESGLDIEWNYFSSAQILKEEMNFLTGVLLCLMLAILAGDHFTKDHQKHWSVTHGLPVSWKQTWRANSSILFLLFWAVVLVGSGISYLIGTILDTSGSLHYPTALYFEGGVQYIPMWQYLIIALILSMLLSYILLLLTTGLSWFIRNSYLTILLVSGLYLVPQIWQVIPAFNSWQPSFYLNLNNVLNGTMASLTDLNGVVWWKAGLVYLLMIVILEIVFNQVFSKIPTETTGLKRRVLT